MPGAMIGIETLQKVCQGVAPKVAAASSTARGKSARRALTTMIT